VSLFVVTYVNGQGIYNNGSYLIVPSGSDVRTVNFTNGSSGAVTLGGNIYTSGNWTNNKGSVLTLSSGTVIFNGSSTQLITGNDRTDFNNLTVATGATVEVPASKHVNVNGSLTMTGSLTLLSSATSPTASLIDAGSNTGSLTVKRHLTGGK